MYYYTPLSMHASGTLLTIDTTETGQMRYNIDQNNEPAGLTAFMQIQADTNQAQQQYGFTVELNPMTTAQWRVRQYTDSNGEAYEDVVPWMAVNGSGPQMALVASVGMLMYMKRKCLIAVLKLQLLLFCC